MKRALVILAVALASCTPPAAPVQEEAAVETSTVPEAPAQPVTGDGFITAIDAAAGRVTINHDPIDAIGWPAMVMAFDADPAVLEGLELGDHVAFELKSADEPGTIVVLTRS